ncbi:MAG: hypothetical protein HQ556_00805, partial [Candidatus Marinimicrobia bacterium]|nr:hypothetical protein [Candidatus Neomarinimicrobiota bacterium]
MKKLIVLMILFLPVSLVYGQFSHMFTQIARNLQYGYAVNVAVGPNGTIFLANDNDGLRAYSYDGSVFTNTAHI